MGTPKVKTECEFCGKLLNRHSEMIYGQIKIIHLCTACFHHLYPTQAERDKLYARGEHLRLVVR